MAPVRWKVVALTLASLLACVAGQQTRCSIPEDYAGDWYWMDGAGRDAVTIVNREEWADYICVEKKIHYNDYANVEGVNSTMLMLKKGDSTCYICLDVLYRTKNILQVRKSDCYTSNSGFERMCPGYKELPTVDQVRTYFRQTLRTINCITTFEGVYQFTYEVSWGGGGICDNLDSQLKACQDPGSPYVDNEVFFMTYARCPEVQTSFSQTVRYQCMGSWFAMIGNTGYTFAAIADTVEKDRREKFKCLMTLKNQKSADNTIRWVMSRFAQCDTLNSLYNGPVRLVLRRIPPRTPYMTPQCNLPRNISGEWFTQGIQFKSKVIVNDTHIKYFTRKNEFEYEETYLSCQQTLGTRYLMTKVIVGKCEVDFVCYDIIPRHHGIVRYRVGKPSRLTNDELAQANFMQRKFRESCSWMSFTFNRNDTDWKYEVLILDPPSPVTCPVGGRYTFQQWSNGELEKYATRIRGVTDRPRVQVDCRILIPELKSCSQDRSRIEVDAEYCEAVDYRGRPIGEYDEPDHILTCVGFWMEDMKSYLITYDEEDAISKFRCWVFERVSWTEMRLSRSQTARCVRGQKSDSYMMEGTGLMLYLSENERLFDDCPQRFDPGINPYSKATVIYVLSAAPSHFTMAAMINTLLCVLITTYVLL
ncbi:hypothetical protein BaRGS_00000504 [Batillaria attramentaria]|uniref:Uncharacterized protein n=1 Tax=Batillaria attramentaria TaxID=370345 RepID=A0ABD0M8L4_9CAEN